MKLLYNIITQESSIIIIADSFLFSSLSRSFYSCSGISSYIYIPNKCFNEWTFYLSVVYVDEISDFILSSVLFWVFNWFFIGVTIPESIICNWELRLVK
jgi:hypothetical protein